MEGGGPGAEAPLISRVHLLPAATALRGDERAREVLLQWAQPPHLSLRITLIHPLQSEDSASTLKPHSSVTIIECINYL